MRSNKYALRRLQRFIALNILLFRKTRLQHFTALKLSRKLHNLLAPEPPILIERRIIYESFQNFYKIRLNQGDPSFSVCLAWIHF